MNRGISKPGSSARRHPLWELTKARLREFFREKGTVFWVFVFPLLMAMGLGLAFRSRPSELPRVAVVGNGSAQLREALLSSERLRVREASASEARQQLLGAKVDLVIELDGTSPLLRFDPTQDRGTFAELIAKDVLQRAAGRSDPLPLREQPMTEPGSRYIDFLLPGLIGLNVMGSSMWGVGYNLVVARKRKLLRRYAVTPMRRSHFLLAYFFSRSFFLVLELAVLVAFGGLLFGSSVRGSYVALLLVSFSGAAAFAGISLLIGARVENTETANGWMNFVQLPMWVFSGAFFSYERFPEWLQGFIRLLPLTAVIDGLRAVYNEGAGLLACAGQLAVLIVWTGLGFGIALRVFRWQ